MVGLKKDFLAFLEPFGVRMETHGFPRKPIRSTNFFQQRAPSGVIGLHLSPRYWPGEGCSINFRCAVSIEAVQSLLVHTELYAWDGGLTWSFGIDLSELRPDSKFETSSYDLSVNPPTHELESVAEQVFQDFHRYGWPFLQRYGSEEGALELTLRTDRIAELCFLDPIKPLAGIILAKKLGKRNAIPKLLKAARKRFYGYAKHGNPEPRDLFRKLVLQLGLLSESELVDFDRGFLHAIFNKIN